MTGASPDQQPPHDDEHDIELDVEGHAMEARDAARVAAEGSDDVEVPDVDDLTGGRLGSPQPKMRH